MRMKTPTRLIVALAISTTVLAGCSKHETTTAEAPAASQVAAAAEKTPENLGRIGAEIKKQPQDAEKILSSHGMTEETFKAAVKKVAEDPAASKRYAAAFNGA
jgi:hypothetical protein